MEKSFRTQVELMQNLYYLQLKKNARMLFISPEALLENPAFAKVIRRQTKTGT